MSLQGRISKTKKSLYDAKEKLGNLEQSKFTPHGVHLIKHLNRQIEASIEGLGELKDEIEGRQKPTPSEEEPQRPDIADDRI
jgi:hypothetical protein